MFRCRLVSRGTILAILVLVTLGVLEGIILLGIFSTSIGIGEFSVDTLPFSWNTKFQYAPLVLIDWLDLPSSVAIGLLLTVYHILGGIFAFLLAREYMGRGQRVDSSRLPLVPLLAGITYMMFPWNTFGDNFPTLVLVRALAPLVILLLLLALRTGVLRWAILGGLVLGLMTMGDPRSIIFIIPLSFLIVTLPEVSVKAVGMKAAVKANLVFVLSAAAGSIVEIIYRLPGIVAGGAGTSSSSPAASINPDAFIPNFTHASPLQYLAGISFEATYQDYTGLLRGVPGLTTFALLLGMCFILALALYCLFLLPRGADRRRSLLILAVIALATIFLTVWVPGDKLPFIYYVLLNSDVVRESSMLSTLMIMFRTMRFANLLLALALVPLVTIVLKDLMPRWSELRAFVKERGVLPQGRGLKGKLRDRQWQKMAALTMVFVLVFSGIGAWLLPQVARGQGMAFLGGITFETSEESIELSSIIAQINQDPTVDRILSIQPVNNNLPNMYMYQDVEGGVSQYLVHYSVDTLYSPVLRDGDYDYLANLLNVMGVGYVVVNGRMIDSYYGGEYGERMVQTPSYSSITAGLENSTSFTKVAEKGKVAAFKVIKEASSPQGMYVLGGLEDFRKAYPYLSNTTGGDVLPVMLDSDFDLASVDDLPDWPILIGPHRTMDDLSASLALLTSTGTALAPSEWIGKQWSPHENWSPGYIQDKIGGGWSPILLDVTNYEWSFSYTPDMGYAYVEGAQDTITTQVDLDDQEYVVLARVLYSQEGGDLKVRIDNSTYYLDTQWQNESGEFLWTSLGTASLGSGTQLQLSSMGGINAVNSILVVPKDDWSGLQELSSQFLDEREVVQILDPERAYLNSTDLTSGTTLSVLKEGTYEVVSGGPNITIGTNTNLSEGQSLDLSHGDYQTVFHDYLSLVYGEEFSPSTKIRIRGNSPWSPNILGFNWTIDSETSTSGGSSLNVTTGVSNDSLWSDIRGPVIPVTPGRECVVSLDMKWYNAHQSHVVVNGVREDGSYYRLAMVMPGQDGTSNWTTFSVSFMVPSGTTGIRLFLNAGAVYNRLYPSTTTWFDNLTVMQGDANSPELILSQGIASEPGLVINDVNTTVLGGFTNKYDITTSGTGNGLTYVPETFYGSSWELTYAGQDVLPLPVYTSFLGLEISAGNATTGTVEIRDPLDVLVGQLSVLVFASMFATSSLILISMCFGPWRIKSKEKHYAQRGD